MQSHVSSTKKRKTKVERPVLPWGNGSARIRGKVFWITYRDAKGKIHIDNSGTADPVEARRIMAIKALPRALAAVAELEAIINGTEAKGSKRPGRGTVAAVGAAPDAAAGKTGKGGKA